MRRGFVQILVGAAVALWLGIAFSPSLLHVIRHPQPVAKLAAWGEAFGSLTALFTAAGFVALVMTLREQQKQNKESARDQHKQRFDTSFFQLLQLLREARDEIAFRYGDEYRAETRKGRGRLRGMAAFHNAWNEVYHWIEQENPRTRQRVGLVYEVRIHERYESRFSPYFRIFYTILYRLKQDKVLTIDEKLSYSRLLRGQLSSYEVALAALNGLAPFSKDFSNLLAEFHMLKYLPPGRRQDLFRRFYPERAFTGHD